MFKRLVLIAICAVFLGTALVTAQDPPPPPQATARPEAQAPTPPPPRPRTFGQPVTIRIDLTISDQVGTGTPTRKTMTLLAADGERASVRSINRAQGGPAPSATFNVDAKPMLAQDKIRLDLSIYYDPPPLMIPLAGDEKPVATATTLQESMGVVVENGKPLVVSQSADPRTDRKVTVEVKATILK